MPSLHTSPAQPQPISIAIVGGGIIGLVLALGLLKRGVHVTVYEQSGSLREIGAGVAFTANAVQCMSRIDPAIVKCLRAVATANGDADNPNDWLRYVDGFHQDESNPDEEQLLFKLYAGYRGFEGCHRAHFLAELVKIIPEGTVVFKKRLQDVIDSHSRLELKFEDGTTVEADAVVGCDGIKSQVRKIILGEDNPASYPRYTHRVCYRGLIPMDKAVEVLGEFKARNQHMHVGPKAHMIHFPVAGQTLVNVAAFALDPEEWSLSEGMVKSAKREEVEVAFADFAPTSRRIAGLLPAQLDKWAIFDTYDHQVPFYNLGRICIAGDAAHAAAPHHGAGAGIGIEDCLCLSTLLESATKAVDDGAIDKPNALERAFASFNEVRLERCHWLVDSSHNICDVYEWQDPVIGNNAEMCFKEVEWRSHKIWNFDIEGMLGDSRRVFRSKLAGVPT